ncbi:hypothetical protein DDZ16_17555 [Marinilabilia rubra]|uniref:Uncharacterized protein n=1 Tax=Marinilabilia rubra TaxID=2162893 RepID=A0A2U2B4L8_9BACT|nr:hypothetical protein DDZ16_17555 [Marinilabilia rubra]
MLNDIIYWLDLKKETKILWLSDKREKKKFTFLKGLTVKYSGYNNFFSKNDGFYDLCFCDFPYSMNDGNKLEIKDVFDKFQGERVLVWNVKSDLFSDFLIRPLLGIYSFPGKKTYYLPINELQALSPEWEIEKQLFVYCHKANGFLLSDSAFFLNSLQIWFPNSRRINFLNLILKSKCIFKWLKKKWPVRILVCKKVIN